MATDPRGAPGPAVDALGNPVIDPTKNVLDLVEAAIKRLDDIGEEIVRRQDDSLQAAIKRSDDLRDLESRHIREIVTLRAELDDKLRLAETDRINAIRAVDVAAVAQALSVAETRAATLSATVAASAEALRNQVGSAATAQATALTQALVPLQEAIADLRRAQYEAQGQKTQVVEARDNAADLAPLLAAIHRLETTQAERVGQAHQVTESRSNFSAVAAVAIGSGALLLTAIFGVLGAYIATHP